MQYILETMESEGEPGCIFCPPRDDDKERLILLRSSETLVIMNRYPYTNGHLLIAPTRHTALIEDLTSEESASLFSMVAQSVSALKSALNPDGLNIGINQGRVAGAGVEDHLHVHIVPRWNGDHNFMAILAEVRVVNEHLVETYRRLKPYFQTDPM